MNQSFKAFDYWHSAHNAPYHFPMTSEQWYASMYEDVDSDGRKLFDKLTFRYYRRPGLLRKDRLYQQGHYPKLP